MAVKRDRKEKCEELAVITPVQRLRVLTSPHPAKKERRQTLEALRRVDVNVKKLALLSCGAAAAVSLVGLAGRYTFYRGVMSAELKRQLAAVNKKLDLLAEQNEQLRAELEKQKEKN